MQIEAIAQVAMREGLSEEQVLYEQGVDRQPLGAVVGWEEMGVEERGRWCREVLGREWKGKGNEGEELGGGCGEGEGGGGGRGVEGDKRVEFRGEEKGNEAVGDLGESRWIAVRTEHAVEEKLGSETPVVAELGECPLISTGMLKLHSEIFIS
jgi:hypothetical protein